MTRKPAKRKAPSFKVWATPIYQIHSKKRGIEKFMLVYLKRGNRKGFVRATLTLDAPKKAGKP